MKCRSRAGITTFSSTAKPRLESGPGGFLAGEQPPGRRQPGRARPALRVDTAGIPYWGRGSRSRFSATALRATSKLEPDIEIAAISGLSVTPKGSKTPAAIGRASEL